jgi:hypothetical protein
MAEKQVQAPDQTASPEQVKSYRQLQAEEYGAYVAVAPIDFNGVRAFNPGDPVPKANVARFGYERDKLVAKTGSAEAIQVVRGIHEATLNREPVVIEPVSLGVPVDGR